METRISNWSLYVNYSMINGSAETDGQTHASWERSLGYGLVYYGFPIIVLLGTIGNMLALCVLLRRRMRTTSVNVYLAALAVADTCVLLLSAARTWLRVITGFTLLHSSNAACKTIMFAFLLSIHVSAWLLVAVSFDRWVVVWLPFRALTCCKVRRAVIVTSVTIIVLALYNIHIFWTVDLISVKDRMMCSSSLDNYFMTTVFPWLKLISYSCVPFILVLTLNTCIILRISLTRNLAGIAQSSNQRRVTVMLLFVSFAFLSLTAPFTLWNFIYPSFTLQNSPAAFLAKAFCFCFMYANHGINFYIYCLTGYKFRVELRLFFHSLCDCRRRSALKPRLSLRTGPTGLPDTKQRGHNNNQHVDAIALNGITSRRFAGKSGNSSSSDKNSRERSSGERPHGTRNAHFAQLQTDYHRVPRILSDSVVTSPL